MAASVEIGKFMVSSPLVPFSRRENMKLKGHRGMILLIVFILWVISVEAQRSSSPCHRKCSYVEAFQQADCEDRQLDTIPIECNAASYLSLSSNRLTTIEPGIFRGFPFLKYLILSHNSISHIDANTFIGAPQLKSIKLLYNNLQTFDQNALNGTENRLRNLYLSRNSLSVIEEGTFQLVPKLEVIDLYKNHLTQLTSRVFRQLENLKRLFLGMNKFVDLPEDAFKDLLSLVYLDLSNNSLSSLATDLFVHMDNLMTIDLSGNRLIDIGNALNLPDIRLDLRWNRLYQLGNVSMETLTNNVEILFLEGNPLHCSCSLEPLRQWYQQLSIRNDADVKIDNPVCSDPNDLASRTIGSLTVSLCKTFRPTLSDVLHTQGTQTGIVANIPEMKTRNIYDIRFESLSDDGNSTNVIMISVLSTIISVVVVCIIVITIILVRKGLIAKCFNNVNKMEDIERNDSEESSSEEDTNESTPLKRPSSARKRSGEKGFNDVSTNEDIKNNDPKESSSDEEPNPSTPLLINDKNEPTSSVRNRSRNEDTMRNDSDTPHCRTKLF